MEKKYKVKLIYLVIFMIVIDQILKALARIYKCSIFNDKIIYFENTNMDGLASFILSIIIIFAIVIIYIIKNKKSINLKIIVFSSMIFAGGISNLTDIIIKKSVTDYIYIFSTNINLSDIYLILGCVLFVVAAIVNMKQKFNSKLEMVDKFNNKRQMINKVDDRYKKVKGEYMQSVHIWIMNDKGEFLIQKRTPNKKFFPNLWSQTGGAVDENESTLDAAVRECNEELGIKIDTNNMELMLSFKRKYDFVDVWLVRQNFDIQDLIFQEDEVQDAKWVTIEELKHIMKSNQFVSSVDIYFEMMLQLFDYEL